MIIDTHSHIYDSDYALDFDQMILRAKQAGVIGCVLPGIDSSSYADMMDASAKLPGFAFPCIGLHPTSVKEDWEGELKFVEDKLASEKFYAIGEIGLDGYWSKDFIAQQQEVLYRQILLACGRDLPIIIHLREATNEVFQVLERVRSEGLRPRGTFHAFAGSLETFERIQKYGDFKAGIGGVVTYKNAGIASVLKDIPLECILLETDSPYLSPVPFRGKRNESSYLTYIIEKISELKGCEVEEIERVTTKNAIELFNLNIKI